MYEGEAIFLVAYDFQRLVSRARLNFAKFISPRVAELPAPTDGVRIVFFRCSLREGSMRHCGSAAEGGKSEDAFAIDARSASD